MFYRIFVMMSALMLYTPDTLPVRPYRRIVSLVPSLTETLAGLGLAQLLVGRTRFCTSSPGMLGGVARVGGTKTPDLGKIRALQPDLVLTVKEENNLADAHALAANMPVLVFDIATVQEGLACADYLCQLLGGNAEGWTPLRQAAQAALAYPAEADRIRVLYLIWQDPYMTVGLDTYIADMLHQTGFALPNPTWRRYPAIDLKEAVRTYKPQALLLSSEPYPFKTKHAKALQIETGLPAYLVDGQLFSWYGTLTPAGLAYANELRLKIAAGQPD